MKSMHISNHSKAADANAALILQDLFFDLTDETPLIAMLQQG
jgi:hypothetical protein